MRNKKSNLSNFGPTLIVKENLNFVDSPEMGMKGKKIVGVKRRLLMIEAN